MHIFYIFYYYFIYLLMSSSDIFGVLCFFCCVDITPRHSSLRVCPLSCLDEILLSSVDCFWCWNGLLIGGLFCDGLFAGGSNLGLPFLDGVLLLCFCLDEGEFPPIIHLHPTRFGHSLVIRRWPIIHIRRWWIRAERWRWLSMLV